MSTIRAKQQICINISHIRSLSGYCVGRYCLRFYLYEIYPNDPSSSNNHGNYLYSTGHKYAIPVSVIDYNPKNNSEGGHGQSKAHNQPCHFQQFQLTEHIYTTKPFLLKPNTTIPIKQICIFKHDINLFNSRYETDFHEITMRVVCELIAYDYGSNGDDDRVVGTFDGRIKGAGVNDGIVIDFGESVACQVVGTVHSCVYQFQYLYTNPHPNRSSVNSNSNNKLMQESLSVEQGTFFNNSNSNHNNNTNTSNNSNNKNGPVVIQRQNMTFEYYCSLQSKQYVESLLQYLLAEVNQSKQKSRMNLELFTCAEQQNKNINNNNDNDGESAENILRLMMSPTPNYNNKNNTKPSTNSGQSVSSSKKHLHPEHQQQPQPQYQLKLQKSIIDHLQQQHKFEQQQQSKISNKEQLQRLSMLKSESKFYRAREEDEEQIQIVLDVESNINNNNNNNNNNGYGYDGQQQQLFTDRDSNSINNSMNNSHSNSNGSDGNKNNNHHRVDHINHDHDGLNDYVDDDCIMLEQDQEEIDYIDHHHHYNRNHNHNRMGVSNNSRNIKVNNNQVIPSKQQQLNNNNNKQEQSQKQITKINNINNNNSNNNIPLQIKLNPPEQPRVHPQLQKHAQIRNANSNSNAYLHGYAKQPIFDNVPVTISINVANHDSNSYNGYREEERGEDRGKRRRKIFVHSNNNNMENRQLNTQPQQQQQKQPQQQKEQQYQKQQIILSKQPSNNFQPINIPASTPPHSHPNNHNPHCNPINNKLKQQQPSTYNNNNNNINHNNNSYSYNNNSISTYLNNGNNGNGGRNTSQVTIEQFEKLLHENCLDIYQNWRKFIQLLTNNPNNNNNPNNINNNPNNNNKNIHTLKSHSTKPIPKFYTSQQIVQAYHSQYLKKLISLQNQLIIRFKGSLDIDLYSNEQNQRNKMVYQMRSHLMENQKNVKINQFKFYDKELFCGRRTIMFQQSYCRYSSNIASNGNIAGNSSQHQQQQQHQHQKRSFLKVSLAPIPQSPPSSQPKHIIFLVHGLGACRLDMQKLRIQIKRYFKQSVHVVISSSNQGRTQGDINLMGVRFSQEVNQQIMRYFGNQKQFKSNSSNGHGHGHSSYKISFIGHSMGGIIIRSALPKLQKYKHMMNSFVTLSSPHLGYCYSSSKLVDVGLWMINNWKKCQSILQLTMADLPTANSGSASSTVPAIQNTFLYKLSLEPGLEWFKKITLLASRQDLYVPYFSARIQKHEQCLNDLKNKYINQYAMTHAKMVDNILSRVTGIINRIDVNFSITEQSVDNLIGRAAHICFVGDVGFLRGLCLADQGTLI